MGCYISFWWGIFGVSISHYNSHDVLQILQKVKWSSRVKNRNSETEEFFRRVRRLYEHALKIDCIRVSLKWKCVLVWPQKCLPTTVRENNNDLPPKREEIVLHQRMSNAYAPMSSTKMNTMSEQNEAKIMWPRRCRRLLLMPVLSEFCILQALTVCTLLCLLPSLLYRCRYRLQRDWLLPISSFA